MKYKGLSTINKKYMTIIIGIIIAVGLTYAGAWMKVASMADISLGCKQTYSPKHGLPFVWVVHVILDSQFPKMSSDCESDYEINVFTGKVKRNTEQVSDKKTTMHTFSCPIIPGFSFLYPLSKGWTLVNEGRAIDGIYENGECIIYFSWHESTKISAYISVNRLEIDGVLDIQNMKVNPHGVHYVAALQGGSWASKDPTDHDFGQSMDFYFADTGVRVTYRLSEEGSGEEPKPFDKELFFKSVVDSFVVSDLVPAKPQGEKTEPMLNSNTDPIYEIDEVKVREEKFNTFLKSLQIVKGSQINGESPSGLFTSYEAFDLNKMRYIITINGYNHQISKLPNMTEYAVDIKSGETKTVGDVSITNVWGGYKILMDKTNDSYAMLNIQVGDEILKEKQVFVSKNPFTFRGYTFLVKKVTWKGEMVTLSIYKK